MAVALVTGEQAAITRQDWRLFRDTGVAHLVSISGLHITMFAWLATAVVGALWRCMPRWCLAYPAPLAAGWAGLALATAYAVFSGWGLPAQRTLGMLAVVVALRSGGLRWPWPRVGLLVLMAVVVVDPWALQQAGFWLSFVAVSVLLAGSATARPGWRAQFGNLLREQGRISLVLAPLTVMLFGQFSLVGLVANLGAIPWVTLVVTPLAMLGVLWAPVWELAAWRVQALRWCLEGMGQWPGAVWHLAQAPAAYGVVAVVAAGWMAMPWPWRVRCLGVPWLLPVLLWFPPRPPAGEVEVWALDVGQGSALLVRTQQHSLLFDAGPQWSDEGDAGTQTLVPLLRAWGERLDRVVISHADSDHAGGAAAVLAAHPQALWMGSDLAQWASAIGRPWVPCQAGQSWVWDGVQFDMLHPPDSAPVQARQHRAGSARNARSCVLRIRSAQGAVALLTGDVEARQEAQLLAQAVDVRSDLLVVPHHGSRTSSSPAWVAATRPQVAVVQAGWGNRFGHPAAQVVARYQAQGSLWRNTATCGAVRWHSQQPGTAGCWRAERTSVVPDVPQ